MVETPSNSQNVDGHDRITLNLTGSLGAFPASSLMDVTFAGDKPDSSYLPDLISAGTISLEAASACFAYFKEQLNPLIHYVLDKSATLAVTRARSAFLTTAICTVASFCTGSKDYESCLKIYRNEVSRKLFGDKHEFDDVRALCIGALWLSDISSTLNGLGETMQTLDTCISVLIISFSRSNKYPA